MFKLGLLSVFVFCLMLMQIVSVWILSDSCFHVVVVSFLCEYFVLVPFCLDLILHTYK